MSGVTSVSYDANGAVAYSGGDGDRFTAELVITFAGDGDRRDRERRHLVAEPRLRARAAAAQGGGQPRGPSTSRRSLVGIEWHIGEKRLGQPFVKERVRANLFEVTGQRLVARPALGSLAGVLDAAGGAEKHEPRDERRMAQRHVDRYPCAKGVAAEVGRAVEQRRYLVGAVV